MEIMEILKEAEKSAVSNQEVRDMTKNCLNLKGGRQGDVYIVRCDTDSDIRTLEKIIAKNKNPHWQNFSFGDKFEKRKTNQLADGSSKGSRHCAEGKIDILFSKNGHPCAGGLITAHKEWELTHPEHAHFKFAAGQFVFFFQLDSRKEGEVRRVQD